LSGTQHRTHPESAVEITAAKRKSARIESPDWPAASRSHYLLSANFDGRLKGIREMQLDFGSFC
jgi:hypothetical protein